MFLGIPPAIQYSDPWLASYDDRLSQLTKQRKRIAYYYETPDTSTFRYRAYNPGLTLAAHPGTGISGAWFDHRDLQADGDFVEFADALVMCRTRYNAAVAQLIARARARRIPVIFDCDDLVFDPERIHLLMDSLNENMHDNASWDGFFALVGRFDATLRLCDAFITTNDYLAARAREYAPRLRTAVVPNYLHPRQQALSETIYHQKRKSGWLRDGRIHIGYFSGSPTHARDFAVAAPALYRLLEQNPRIVLRVAGFLARNNDLMRFKDQIEFFPLQDFFNLQRLIGEVEINIAPLQENTFTNCKSELKFFEAAICGTLTLASPTFSFKNSIADRKTGLLVPAHGWDAALREAVRIVENRRHYEQIASAAFSHVQEAYGWDRHAERIAKAVFGSRGVLS